MPTYSAPLVLTLLFTSLVAAQPVVVPDSVLGRPFGGFDFDLTVYQDPELSDETGFAFDYEFSAPPPTFSTELRFDNAFSLLDEGVEFYVAAPGSVMGPGATPPLFNDPPNLEGVRLTSGLVLTADSPLLPPPTTPGYQPLFLSFGTSEFGNGSNLRTIFGWVEIELPTDPSSGLEPRILGSATAFFSQGIIVGTLTAIPEPSAAALLVAAALAYPRRFGRG